MNTIIRNVILGIYFITLITAGIVSSSIVSGTAFAAGCDQTCEKVLGDLKQAANSQVGPHCAAYKASDESKGPEIALMALDLAVAGMCGYACVAQTVQPWMYSACAWGSFSAGAAELISSLAMKSNSTLQKVIGAAGGSAGAYYGYKGISAVSALKAASSSSGLTTAAAKEAAAKKSSCISAITFAMMTGLRAANMNKQDEMKENSCNAVTRLASEYPVLPQGSASGGSTAGQAGSSSGGRATDQARQGLQCISSKGGLSACVTNAGKVSASATDAGFLSRSGLDRAVAPMALEGLDKLSDKLKDKLNGKVNAGSMLSAMSGDSLGEFGADLAKIANSAQEHADEFGSISSVAFTNGGKGGSNVNTAKGDGILSFPGFNFNNDQKTTGTSTLVSFNSQERKPAAGDDDIWHSSSTMTIFQIVSIKLNQSAGRIEKLDWSTQLNRALTGTRSQLK
ncbi:MAG: hypothetical protein AABZ06_12015 [Bdellovibrionota bacterium]